MKKACIETKINNLLTNCVKRQMPGIIAGAPGTGKTELLKLLAREVSSNERLAVIESVPEVSDICKSMDNAYFSIVTPKENFGDAINGALAVRATCILLSELDGDASSRFITALATGTQVITTMRAASVADIPNRIYYMDSYNERLTNRSVDDIYRFLDWSILLCKDENGELKLSQFAFYTRVNEENKATLIYDNGKYTGESIPEEIMKKFNQWGITDPYLK